ncbi:hypothetical protein OK074_8379 [Actinobacteria bacterium OK074]|nr:hypothetical protein OK074_8379 [Actinobacteria bacterium OK074]
MKVQERSGAGGGRAAGLTPPMAGERLPAPPRERKPALAALAVLLILVGALGATMLVLQAGDRIEVVKVTGTIQPGDSVTNADVTSVMVAADDGIDYVKWSQLAALKQLKARSTIYAGTVVVGQMFGDDTGLSAGQAVVGLSLKAGQYPTDIQQGDVVSAYKVTSDTNSSSTSGTSGLGSDSSLIVARATVSYVQQKSGSSVVSSTNLPVTLTVDSDKAAALAQAASNGDVALVVVPGTGK